MSSKNHLFRRLKICFLFFSKSIPAHVIRDPKLVTPTGKFNVFNTQHDVY